MKNREKYKNELMDVINKDGNICEFMINHDVSQMFGKDMESFCRETECQSCTTALQLWLDEEYEEPPKPEVDWSNVPVDTLVRVRDDEEEPEVDWGKVPVDTLVRVRDDEDEYWILRYFKGINDNHLRQRYEAWKSGETSKTANGEYLCWNYCELVEDENDGSN